MRWSVRTLTGRGESLRGHIWAEGSAEVRHGCESVGGKPPTWRVSRRERSLKLGKGVGVRGPRASNDKEEKETRPNWGCECQTAQNTL